MSKRKKKESERTRKRVCIFRTKAQSGHYKPRFPGSKFKTRRSELWGAVDDEIDSRSQLTTTTRLHRHPLLMSRRQL